MLADEAIDPNNSKSVVPYVSLPKVTPFSYLLITPFTYNLLSSWKESLRWKFKNGRSVRPKGRYENLLESAR